MIIQWEQSVLRELNWRVTYNTLATWSNLFMLKWDDFVSLSPELFSHLETKFNISLLPQFRKQANENYYLFRNFYQILDLLTLNSNTIRFKDRSLVLAIMYLNIGLCVGAFNLEKVTKFFPLHTHVLSEFPEFNCVFREFMNIQIGLDFCDIIDAIQYTSRFYVLKFDYSSPYNNGKEEEDYVSFLSSSKL